MLPLISWRWTTSVESVRTRTRASAPPGHTSVKCSADENLQSKRFQFSALPPSCARPLRPGAAETASFVRQDRDRRFAPGGGGGGADARNQSKPTTASENGGRAHHSGGRASTRRTAPA